MWDDEFSTAYLPGVGFLTDPQPADLPQGYPVLEHNYLPIRVSQRSLCDRLKV
jgi:hypothetical protein